jgi:hypothetical protein
MKTFSNADATYRDEFFGRPTKHIAQEFAKGDRYTPHIQLRHGEGAMRVAPYLPFVRIIKDFYTYVSLLAHKFVGKDEAGYIVPANGILPVGDGTEFYEGRPLVYADRDTGGGFGEWPDFGAPVNMNPFTGAPLEAGELSAEGVIVDTLDADPTAGGVAGRTFAAIKAGTMPIGCLTDDALNGADRFNNQEFDPAESLTVLLRGVLLFSEQTAMRRNYGQATREAILLRNQLVSRATVINLNEVGTGTGATELEGLPFWANQGSVSNAVATAFDIIRPGDFVAVNDSGDPIRFDARVDDWNSASTPAAPTDLEMNGRYPIAALQSVIGRCHAREKVEVSTPLALVKTFQDKVLGGSGTGGIETIYTRGAAMTSGQVTSIIATNKPESGANNAYAQGDAEENAKYLLLIRLQ